MMGMRHLLLFLIYLDPSSVLCAATRKNKSVPKRNHRVKEVNATAVPTEASRGGAQLRAPATGYHDTCLGYYDVSGQFDKEFECNNTDHRYCCGSCFLRFCCQFKAKQLDQRGCTNYNTPDWIKTLPPSPVPTGETYDPNLDKTNTTVYISCGVIAFIIILGISAKIAYDKATKPPQEMNVHRALADILRQQGPPQTSQHESAPTVEESPKDNSPVRTSKNHYTPIHTKANHGHYGNEDFRTGGQDLHTFISSGFVTLARPPLKAQHSVDGTGHMGWAAELDVPTGFGNQQHNYSHLDLTLLTPKMENPRMNRILTSQTEPYDLSFSTSFQNLTLLPPSYEMGHKSDFRVPDPQRSHHEPGEKRMDNYYLRPPELPPRGALPLHAEQKGAGQRQRPRRVQRALSQDHVLSPECSPRHHGRAHALPSYALAYGGRILSEEQLLSAERLQSRDPLLSPDQMLTLKRPASRQRAMSRALSHADVFLPTTPVVERHKVTKMHSHASAPSDAYNTLTVNHSANKRQAFASRRMHTVDHLQYLPAHQQYRTASKSEVTV